MSKLFEYDILINEVFYKCWHILEYIEKHPDMSELDKEAIKATIMDALVTKKLVDPTKQSLDFDNLCIVNNLNHYVFEKHPNISGIPLWMKEEFRKKSLTITGGIPISMFLAKPPSKFIRFCVYDPNTAVSAIFEDATFYNCVYTSPTRGIKIDDVRPFVEVNIDNELYLVDTITKRILKSSWFKKTYDFKSENYEKISEMNEEKLNYYKQSISDYNSLGVILSTLLPLIDFTNIPEMAEMIFETEMSKKYFPREWEKYEYYLKEMKNYVDVGFFLTKNKT